MPKILVLPPNERHFFRKVNERTRRKGSNSVIMPSVDVAADIAVINRGEAIRQGEDYLVNGRRYRIEQSGRAYPVDGEGIVRLGRGAYRALQVYNSHGITANAERKLDRERIDPAEREVARRVWYDGQQRS